MQYLRVAPDQLSEDYVKNRLRAPMMQSEKWKLPPGDSLAELQKEAIEDRVAAQYSLFVKSHEEYHQYVSYLEAKQQIQLQESIKEKIGEGELSEEQLTAEQKELVEKVIVKPEYISAPYLFPKSLHILKLLLKSHLWETLAIIGVTQLVVLPFINMPFWTRFAVMLLFGISHVWMTYAFNWQFLWGYTENFTYVNPNHGLNNWMGDIWRTGNDRGWDGGCFGVFGWAVVMLAGSLSYDIMKGNSARKNVSHLLVWGIGFLSIGYMLSCLASFYDTGEALEAENKRILASNGIYQDESEREMSLDKFIQKQNETTRDKIEKLIVQPVESSQVMSYRAKGHPASPVIPPIEQFSKRSLTSLLAPLPFMKNVSDQLPNYWLVWKRIVSLPFVLVSTGIAFLVLALFVAIVDIGNIQVGIFRTFGMNPLAAYAIHRVLVITLLPEFLPKDAETWMVLLGLGVFIAIIYLLVRSLEKQQIYIRM
ncbi:hypothetical protein [Polystyrenella longa]|nr:hypothetical protein [Polystyrenella longa]